MVAHTKPSQRKVSFNLQYCGPCPRKNCIYCWLLILSAICLSFERRSKSLKRANAFFYCITESLALLGTVTEWWLVYTECFSLLPAYFGDVCKLLREIAAKRSVGMSIHNGLFKLLTWANYSLLTVASLVPAVFWCLVTNVYQWLVHAHPCTNHSIACKVSRGLSSPSSSKILTSMYLFQLCSATKTQYGSHRQVWFQCFRRGWVELPSWGYAEGKCSPRLD